MGVHMTSGLDSAFAPVLVSSSGDGFHAPDTPGLFLPVSASEGMILGMDRVMMIRLVMYLVLVLYLVLYAIRVKLVPGWV